MEQKKLALVGCGFLGNIIADAYTAGLLEGYRLVGAYSRTAAKTAAVAEKALPYCNIVCIQGAEMESSLSGYLQTLFDALPQSVGGALPGHDFYYGA